MRQGLSATAWLLAATLVVNSAAAAGVSPAQASAAERKHAQTSFLEGKKAYDHADFATAARSFQESLDVVDSPNTRLYLARSLREGGHKTEAYAEFARVEQDAAAEPTYKPAGDAAHDEKASLASSVGLVKLDVTNADENTKVVVGGREVPHDRWNDPVAVEPGDTDVSISKGDKPPVKKTVHVDPGSSPTEVALDADAAPAAEPSGSEGSASGEATVSTPSDRTKLRPYAYVAGGVGAVGLLTFVIAGLAANSTYGDLESSCPNGRCPSNQSDAISRGKTQQTVANIGLVFGVVGLAAGATLFVLSMPKKDASTPPPSAAFRVGPSGAGFVGRF